MIDLRKVLPFTFLFILVIVLIHLFLKRKIRTAKLKKWCRSISDLFHEHQSLKVPEFNDNFQENQLYCRVSLYVNSLESLEDSDHTNMFSDASKSTDIVLTLNRNQTIEDTFLGARFWWTNQVVVEGGGEKRAFVLKLRKRDKRRILRPYLQHIHTVIEEIEQQRKEVRLFTNNYLQKSEGGGSALGVSALSSNSNSKDLRDNGGGRWRSVPFTHPATMDTIAMDAELKNKIKTDLDAFLKSKQYYHRLGRVWRRSYLLYGPSGTGKSSFVAAMTKFLSYDVYDIDLTKVSGDSDLKMLLLQTTNRSVILIEDFDKYVSGNSPSYHFSPTTISLSGILNFMDGVVNSCCDERIMVFTMTTKDHIDPVLLRPGRIDVHIYFPLCDFNNFKNLASNYLGVKDHKLFPQVQDMFLSGATLSPAEIGELMMVNRNSPSRALKSVITALQTDGAREREKNGRKNVTGGDRQLSARETVVDESVDSVVGVGCKDGAKEIRKFYGLLRRKSMKKSESFDLGT